MVKLLICISVLSGFTDDFEFMGYDCSQVPIPYRLTAECVIQLTSYILMKLYLCPILTNMAHLQNIRARGYH